MKFNARNTLVILALLTLVGAAYMSIGVLDMSPTKQVTRLTLMLNTSGGLMPTSEVTMRGIKVGRVTGIQTTTTGLAVSIDLDRAHPVPASSAISVENLSAAGEQYIDFKPELIAPPYFSDGTVIPADRVAPMVTGSDLLTKANALMSALNLDQVHTLSATPRGVRRQRRHPRFPGHHRRVDRQSDPRRQAVAGAPCSATSPRSPPTWAESTPAK